MCLTIIIKVYFIHIINIIKYDFVFFIFFHMGSLSCAGKGLGSEALDFGSLECMSSSCLGCCCTLGLDCKGFVPVVGAVEVGNMVIEGSIHYFDVADIVVVGIEDSHS